MKTLWGGMIFRPITDLRDAIPHHASKKVFT